MGAGRVAQPVNGLQGGPRGGVEAERVVRLVQVVVHRLGHTDGLDAVQVVQLGGDAQRVLAPQGNQGVDLKLLQVRQHGVALVLLAGGERVGARGAQDRTTLVNDPLDALQGQRRGRAFHQTSPALREADDLVAVVQAAQDRAPNGRVQAGAVPAAGQHTDSHVSCVS